MRLTKVAVDRWLAAIDLEHFSNKFFQAGVTDFLMLPLLRDTSISQLVEDECGAADVSQHIEAITRLDQYERMYNCTACVSPVDIILTTCC